MKRTLIALSLVALSGSVGLSGSAALSGSVLAQETPIGVPPRVTLSAPIAVEEVQVTESQQQLTPSSVTPEMWLYSEQMRRYDDPAQSVRRKAEYKAAQRLNRLSSLKWFGFSNIRPQAAATPMMSIYSPAWVGNGSDRYDWVGSDWPVTTVRVESASLAR